MSTQTAVNFKSKKIQKEILSEALNLKHHASKAELAKLDLDTFNPKLPGGCVYGQITGECHSTRAKHLLELCAKPFSHKINEYVPASDEHDFSDRKLFVVGNHDVYSVLEFGVFSQFSKVFKI